MKKLLIVISLILLSYIAVAGVVQEFNFRPQGYSDLYISDFNGEKCANFEFLSPGQIDGRVYPILSLKAQVSPAPKNSSKIAVTFNRTKLGEIGYADFKEGVARIQVPQGLMDNTNTVKVCGTVMGSTNTIRVLADSVFGIYSGAYFPQGKGFKMDLETYLPFVGAPFEITATARNYGTEDINVFLSYRKAELERAAPEVSVLEGETSKTGAVQKCKKWDSENNCTQPGEFGISYFIVAHKAVPFTLLPSVMKFTNVFGEEETVLTNRPDLGAIEPPHKISAKVALDNDKLYTGSNIPIKITVQNISKQRVGNIVVGPKTGLEITGETTKTIPSLEPNQEQDVIFTAKALTAGNYELGCSALYESRELDCETTTVTLQKGLGVELLSSIALALISLGA